MFARNKEKLCWNCEGVVTLETLFCPYCGSNVVGQEGGDEKDLLTKLSQHKTQQLSSLYKPPYTPSQNSMGFRHNNHDMFEEEPERFFEEPRAKSNATYREVEDSQEYGEVGGVWPILFMSLGINLLTLGLLLFFFSDHGKLTLEWNSHYWFIYCVLAIPVLMLGWKLINTSKPKHPHK